eukprot:1161151-Pelagomonas_calceolata.AAC.6
MRRQPHVCACARMQEEDTLFPKDSHESMEHLGARVVEFMEWLMQRPEHEVAVKSGMNGTVDAVARTWGRHAPHTAFQMLMNPVTGCWTRWLHQIWPCAEEAGSSVSEPAKADLSRRTCAGMCMLLTECGSEPECLPACVTERVSEPAKLRSQQCCELAEANWSSECTAGNFRMWQGTSCCSLDGANYMPPDRAVGEAVERAVCKHPTDLLAVTQDYPHLIGSPTYMAIIH